MVYDTFELDVPSFDNPEEYAYGVRRTMQDCLHDQNKQIPQLGEPLLARRRPPRQGVRPWRCAAPLGNTLSRPLLGARWGCGRSSR